MAEQPPRGRGVQRFSLEGNTVLVTGAGRGLGQAMAVAAAEAGAHVVGVSRSADELARTADAAGERFSSLPWDLGQVTAVPDLVDALLALVGGPVHGIVHAAGTQRRGSAEQLTVEDWRRVLALNLEVPFFLSTEVVRRQRRDAVPGSHVFVGSLTNSIALPDVAAYAASKSGLLGVVRSLALEWAPLGVRANCLAPGYVATALTADLLQRPEAQSRVRSRIPMGRLAEPSELGDAAVFLLGSGSSYITGHLLNVDGGWLAA